MAPTDYLKLRGRTYYVRVQIPKNLWAAAGGKREYVQTLKTGDLNAANRLKHAYIAVFQSRIRALEQQKPEPNSDLYEKALGWRSALVGAKQRVILYDKEGQPEWTHEDEFLSSISDEAREFEFTHGGVEEACSMRSRSKLPPTISPAACRRQRRRARRRPAWKLQYRCAGWSSCQSAACHLVQAREPATGIIVVDIPIVRDCTDASNNLSGLIELKG
jgi:hypothetical protein